MGGALILFGYISDSAQYQNYATEKKVYAIFNVCGFVAMVYALGIPFLAFIGWIKDVGQVQTKAHKAKKEHEVTMYKIEELERMYKAGAIPEEVYKKELVELRK